MGGIILLEPFLTCFTSFILFIFYMRSDTFACVWRFRFRVGFVFFLWIGIGGVVIVRVYQDVMTFFG